MKILVVSDTHENYTALVQAADEAAADVVVHLGDMADDAVIAEAATGSSFVKVRGNCDPPGLPEEIVEEIEGVRFFICHGDRQHVKRGLGRLKEDAGAAAAQVALFGHTHAALIERQDGLLMVNPGTMKEGAAEKTYAVLTVEEGEVAAVIRRLPE